MLDAVCDCKDTLKLLVSRLQQLTELLRDTCRDLRVKYHISGPLPPSYPKVPVKVTLLYKAPSSLNLCSKRQKLAQCDRSDSQYMLMDCVSNQLANFVDSFVRI